MRSKLNSGVSISIVRYSSGNICVENRQSAEMFADSFHIETMAEGFRDTHLQEANGNIVF